MIQEPTPQITIVRDRLTVAPEPETYTIGALRGPFGQRQRRVFAYGPLEYMPPMFELIGVTKGRTPGEAVAAWLRERYSAAQRISLTVYWQGHNAQLQRRVYDVHFTIDQEEGP